LTDEHFPENGNTQKPDPKHKVGLIFSLAGMGFLSPKTCKKLQIKLTLGDKRKGTYKEQKM